MVGHYENFNVVSYLVPARLRPHFWAVYAFCRGVDDLGDEYTGDRLAALDAFEEELDRAFRGRATGPRFRALQETLATFELNPEDFLALIEANRRDQRRTRYQSFEDVLDYCRFSAEPVGHMVLGLFGYRDPVRLERSNWTSNALQLTNFWQDVDRDGVRGRCYLPEEDRMRFGVTDEMLARRQGTPEVRHLIAYEVERTRRMFVEGAQLERTVPRRLRWQLGLYRLGGQAVLDALQAQDFDPFRGRPTVSRVAKSAIVYRLFLRGGGAQ